MYIVYVKTQLQKLRKIGLNRTYVLKRFFQLQQLRKIKYMHGIESNIILHRMKIIIKCGKYNQNMYMHGIESNKILDMCRVI